MDLELKKVQRNNKADGFKATPLFDLHIAASAKMQTYADYKMPIQYPTGIIAEHNFTRNSAGLFDVSHMGQITLHGKNLDVALEALVPGNICSLKPGHMRYTQILNENGGIIDDIMVSKLHNRGHESLKLIVNAGCKDKDYKFLKGKLKDRALIKLQKNHALLALQGPESSAVLKRVTEKYVDMPFMSHKEDRISGYNVTISRCGYTGEDGFEIAMECSDARAIALILLKFPEVYLAGLGARDTLRMEAGFCLYGQDINESTTPVEAGLNWSIRTAKPNTVSYPGQRNILEQLKQGPQKTRVGLIPDSKAIARQGTSIESLDGIDIGYISSGGFGPSVQHPIAIGYIDKKHSAPRTPVNLIIRSKKVAATVTQLPFFPHRYFRGNP